jgi:3-mercaptopyruvate sulfurtransferase SseA
MSHPWFQAIWQSMAILTIAVGIGLSVNFLRDQKLPLVADSSDKGIQINPASGGDDLSISFEDAEALFVDKQAVFLDARSREQYRKGHIEGAKSLPWEDFDRRAPQVMSGIGRDAIIITYCDGESCSLSRELALALMAKGYDRVRVLVDGWKLWQQFNLPTEQ